MVNEFAAALWETLYMVALSTLFSGLLGFALALVMILTGARGL
ncbi:MAG TPA: methionine ABC transporter permease, partial [Synergistaceae bacterium]|nr:methionine ABC transporter permease [Synergistaceae bacterium]